MLHIARGGPPAALPSYEDDDYYDEADEEEQEPEEEDPLAAVAEFGTLPLSQVLLRAAPLLGQEDTRLPAAFALLERLKVRLARRWSDRGVDPCTSHHHQSPTKPTLVPDRCRRPTTTPLPPPASSCGF